MTKIEFSGKCAMLAAALAASTLWGEIMPIKNASFGETDANGKPVGWSLSNLMKVGKNAGHNGSPGLSWQSDTPSAKLSTASQDVPGLRKGDTVKLSALVKFEDLKFKGYGAQVTLELWDTNNHWIAALYARPADKSKAVNGEWHVRQIGGLIPDNFGKARLAIHVAEGVSGKFFADNVVVERDERKPVQFVKSSVYRDCAAGGKVRFVASLRTPPELLGKTKAVFVWKDAEGKTVRSDADRTSDDSAEAMLDVGQFGIGEQRVACELIVGGKVIGSESMPFSRVEKLPVRRNWIDENKRCIVDGKPFFPIGIYCYPSVGRLESLTNTPFNTVIHYKLLDKELKGHFNRLGLKTISTLPYKISDEELRRHIRETRTDPCLLAWSIGDEHTPDKIPALCRIYEAVREGDPDHPVYLVQDRTYDLRGFLPTTDVIGLDPYPVPQKPIRTVTDMMRGGKEALFNICANWSVPQSFSWEWYSHPTTRFPTRAEMRSIIWQHIAAGANGVVTFRYHGEGKYPEYWQSTIDVHRELADRTGILLSVEPCPAVSSSNEALTCRAWAKDGDAYVLACNILNEPIEARLTLDGGDWKAVSADFGPLPEVLSGRELNFKMPPIGVSLVRLSQRATPISFSPLAGAKWIGDPGSRNPAFARSFVPRSAVRSATLAVTGAGWYEAYINGRKVGDKVLDPIPTQYDRRVLYSTYDVKELLVSGGNELKLLLGNGLYNVQEKCTWSFERVAWKADPAAIAALQICYEDGTVERVVTDGSWRVAPSPVLFNGFREGEVVLAEERMDGAPRPATVVAGPKGALELETAPASKVVRDVAVEKVEKLADGSTVYRMAENMAGWAKIRFTGLKKGDVVTIRYDERHPSEPKRHVDMYCRSLPSTNACPELAASTAGFQTDRFISAGGSEEFYEPRFTWNGFRYVTIRGAQPEAKDVVGRFVRTSFPKTGSFECDDAGFMKVMDATARAYESNFTDGFPTDCPHREKNGWLGDAALAIPYAACEWGSAESTLAYRNWIRTIADGQSQDGRISSIAPHSGYFHFDDLSCSAGPIWGAALTTIPTTLYRYRRDRSILSEAYPAMRKYVAKMLGERNEDGVFVRGLGDWCAVSWEWSKDRNFRTSREFVCSAFAYLSVCETAAAAETLGQAEDAARFRDEAERIRLAFNRKFYRGNGLYDKKASPTAQATALEVGIVDEAEVPAVRARLVEAVHEMDDKIDFGIVGSRTVFRQLCEAGAVDLAWKLITRPDYPSYLNMVSQDVNTLMENFHGRMSRNHIMFGDVGAWAYEYLAGIRVGMGSARSGLAVTVRPFAPKALNRVKASVELPEGRMSVEWTRRDGTFTLVVDIPNGVSATVVMPDGKRHSSHLRHQTWTMKEQ